MDSRICLAIRSARCWLWIYQVVHNWLFSMMAMNFTNLRQLTMIFLYRLVIILFGITRMNVCIAIPSNGNVSEGVYLFFFILFFELMHLILCLHKVLSLLSYLEQNHHELLLLLYAYHLNPLLKQLNVLLQNMIIQEFSKRIYLIHPIFKTQFWLWDLVELRASFD